MIKLKIKILVALFSILSLNVTCAQVLHDSDLYKIIQAKDALMFEEGFNECNMEKMKEVLPEDFEFYHDKDGMITSRDYFIKTLNKNLCSTGRNSTKRILDDKSMEVYALYENGNLYGAVHTGVHYFGGTTAKFTNLWLNKSGSWEPVRIISYDHKKGGAPIFTNVTFVKLANEELEKYLGKYKFSPEFVLTIVMEENKIYGEAQGEKAELKPYGNHQFLDKNQRIKLKFTLSNGGSVNGLTMLGENGEMKAIKIN